MKKKGKEWASNSKLLNQNVSSHKVAFVSFSSAASGRELHDG